MAGPSSITGGSSKLRKYSRNGRMSESGDLSSSSTSADQMTTSSTIKQTWSNTSPSVSHLSSGNNTYLPSYQINNSRIRKDKPTKHKAHIISHLKRPSQRSSTSIDLDRSALENEGLGIYTNLERDTRYGEARSMAHGRLSGTHNRSTSGASQFSATTMSSLGRPGATYVHPMRQTPRPYTPPLSRSYQNSVMESDQSEGNYVTDLDDNLFQTNSDPLRNASSAGSNNVEPRPSVNLRADSLTRLQTSSQTNVTAGSSLGPTFDLETVSPLSRSSLDFAFRSKSKAPQDPATRAAAVQAARQAFEDREAAKNRKFEKQNSKAQDRELRRRERKEQDDTSRQRSQDRPSRQESFSEKSRNDNRNKSDQRYNDPPKQENTSLGVGSPKKAWLLFLTWLRTRIFKLGKKLKKVQ